MIFRYPSYYDKFHCIADKCEDTCCAGWEIDIDDESYEFYMKVGGEFGERLKNSIKEYESDEEDVYEQHGFILKGKKRCPFLDENNLCDLYRELGEEALCDVCTDTPRNYFEYGGERELSLSASCPEAARLIYAESDCSMFVEKEIDEELDFEETEEEKELASKIKEARERAIKILQCREKPVGERAAEFLRFAEKVQEELNGTPFSPAEGEESPYHMFLKRMVTLTALESISEEWEDWLKLLDETFVESGNSAELYGGSHLRLQEEIVRQEREFEYEHLLVYYAFLFLPRSVDDYDFLGKAKLVIFSYLVIRDMDAAWFCRYGSYDKKTRENVARIYAKEVEHSQNNMEILADDFLFEDSYETGNLVRALLP